MGFRGFPVRFRDIETRVHCLGIKFEELTRLGFFKSVVNAFGCFRRYMTGLYGMHRDRDADFGAQTAKFL